ncbi:MAG: UDP-N-acetylglucosamine acyltransferase [Chthoniobacter sp.]|jgi:UDP-N-acetylglucosamine acyltransferase|nr:UDP-N-acetylglucosamine acyltransferase [Chthoniobacter sp.]
MIHPTAIVHPQAQLGADVEIGPYVCIEGPAVIGEGCSIQSHAVLTGAVRMGKNNRVGYGAVIGAWPQDLSFDPNTHSEVAIGDGNTIREYCTIHRASSEGGVTRVGNDNFLMAGAHLGHDVRLGSQIIIANNALLGGHVEVQDRVFIGGGCVFHQFIRVGRLAILQGNSGFSKDVPPFTIGANINTVVGLNVVGMRRAGLKLEQREEVKRAFKLLYKSGLNTAQALAQASEQQWLPEGREFFRFVEGATKRGICGLLEST